MLRGIEKNTHTQRIDQKRKTRFWRCFDIHTFTGRCRCSGKHTILYWIIFRSNQPHGFLGIPFATKSADVLTNDGTKQNAHTDFRAIAPADMPHRCCSDRTYAVSRILPHTCSDADDILWTFVLFASFNAAYSMLSSLLQWMHFIRSLCVRVSVFAYLWFVWLARALQLGAAKLSKRSTCKTVSRSVAKSAPIFTLARTVALRGVCQMLRQNKPQSVSSEKLGNTHNSCSDWMRWMRLWFQQNLRPNYEL